MRSHAIIIGSGPAGVSAAWPLVKAGLPVVMLDAGLAGPTAPPAERPTLFEVRQGVQDAWRYLLRTDLGAVRLKPEVSPKLRTGASPDFTAGYLHENRLACEDFVAVGALAPGGLSNVWGAGASAFDERDLAGYPIGVADLAPSYRAVAERIGISGSDDDDMAAHHGCDLPLQPALPLSPIAERVLQRYEAVRTSSAVTLGRARNAVLSQPLDGREECTLDNFCMWGCSRGATYNSAHDLARLREFPNFEYRSGWLVDRIRRAQEGYVVEGRRRPEGVSVAVVATTVILAAGALPSTRLVLNLLGRFDQPVRLLTTPAFSLAFAMPGRLGAPLPERSFGMGQLTMMMLLPDGSDDYALGTLFAADSLSIPDLVAHMPLTRRGGLGVIRHLLPTLLIGLVFLPGELSDHRIMLERGSVSCEGRLVIHGGVRHECKSVRKAVMWQVARDFRRLGLYLLPGSAKPYPPGAEVHYGGTLPMGDVTSDFGEVRGAPGLFVVDGSVLNRLPAKHLTFTIMANADRIARGVLKRQP